MKITGSKKLSYLAGFSLAGFFLCLFLFLYFSLVASHGGVFQEKHLDFSLSDSDGAVLFSQEESKAIPEGKTVLSLSNGEKESVAFTLFRKGEVLWEGTLSGGEKTELSIRSDGSPLSLLAKGEQTAVAYLSDEESLLAAAAGMKDGGDLIFQNPVKGEIWNFSAPFRLFGLFSFQELSVKAQGDAPIVLLPEKSFSAPLYVHSPKSGVYYRTFHPSFPKENADYYLKAKSLNGKALSQSLVPVSSFEELARLADPQALPLLSDGAKLVFTNEISLEKDISFSAQVSLEVQKPFSAGDYTLCFSSEKEGEYRVLSALGSGATADQIQFFAPRASLVWEGEGTVPSMSTVAKWSNLKSYNGTPLPLGGEGTAIPALTLTVLEEELVFEPLGNLLLATSSYQISEKSLDEAAYVLSCEGGSAVLEGSLSDGVIVTTDEKGKTRRFALGLLREPKNIPVVMLETENGAVIDSKSQYVSATFAMDGGKSEYDSVAETHIRIRGRGNSSWEWEKKPYKIHFDEPISLLGLAPAEEWALFSNYADKSLMRNRLAQVMSSVLSFEYCPTQVCVDVFLNGEYQGVYTLGEHLEAGEGRVEVDYDLSQSDCGYFLEAGGVVSGVDVRGMNYFHAGLVKFVLIKMPEYNKLTSEQFQYIHDYMLRADEAVKKGEGYEEYLDMESVVDWLIMTELSYNTDCSWRRSTYFTKNPGEKLVMGPMWDFDLAFGNFSKDNPGYDTWVSSEPDDDYVGETWTTHLLEDPEFQALFRARWEEIGPTLVKTAIEEIESQYEILSPSAEENFKRWDILGRKVAFERHDTTEYTTYSSQIYYLKDFILSRAAWLDEQVKAF